MAILEGVEQPTVPTLPTELTTPELDAAAVADPYTQLATDTATQDVPTYKPFTSAADQVGTDVQFQTGVTAKPTSEYATPESMVSTQLANILSTGSPLMTQAENRAKEQANQLGLLSSTMAVGAGQRAITEAALPVAQQDAQTIAGLEKQRQQVEGQGLLAGQQAENLAQGNIAEGIISAGLTTHQAAVSQANQNVQNSFQAAMKAADAKGQVMLNDVNNKWNFFTQTAMTDFDKQWQQRLLEGQVEQERYNTAMNSANQIMQNTQTSITTLMQDPDIMAQDPASVANMFNTIYDQAQASMNFIGSLGEVPQAEFDVMLDAFDMATEFGTADVVQVPTA